MLDDSTRQQLECLFPPARTGPYFELRAIRKKPDPREPADIRQHFHRTDLVSWETLDRWCRQQDKEAFQLYVGVNPRQAHRGFKDDVRLYTTCFTDLDLKKTGREDLPNFPVPPSLLVHSGGGVHVYWLTYTEDRTQWELVQKGIYAMFKEWRADPQVVTDESRVLRLVPYPNRKNGAPIATKIIACNPGVRTPIESLRLAFPFASVVDEARSLMALASQYEGVLSPSTLDFVRAGADPATVESLLTQAAKDCKDKDVPDLRVLALLLQPSVQSGMPAVKVREVIQSVYGARRSKRSAVDRCIAYMGEMKPSIEGQNGSKDCLTAACTCWRFGLADQEAWQAMMWWNAFKSDPPWSEKEIKHKLEDGRKKVLAANEFGKLLEGKPPERRVLREDVSGGDAGSPPLAKIGPPAAVAPLALVSHNGKEVLSNVKWIRIATGEGNDQVIGYRDGEEIWQQIKLKTGDWPRKLGGEMMIVKNDKPVFLKDFDTLYAWLSSYFDVQWVMEKCRDPGKGNRARMALSESKFYAYLRMAITTEYGSIQPLPHEPVRDDVYYLEFPRDARSTGAALAELRARLIQCDEVDRVLLLAAMMTPGWGGPAGARPMFVATSPFKVSAGKSTTFDSIMSLWGGWFNFDPSPFQAHRNKEGLLSESAARVRCIRMDNVMGVLQNRTIESLVTDAAIQGHKLYVGATYRPNYMTWFVTANTPQIGPDIASRSYIITLGKAAHNFPFKTWFAGFEKRAGKAAVNDLLNILANPVFRCGVPDTAADRFFEWQTDVLAPACMLEMNANEQSARDLLMRVSQQMKAERLKYEVERDDAMMLRKFIVDFMVEGGCREDQFVMMEATHMLGRLQHRAFPRLDLTAVAARLTPYLGGPGLAELSRERRGNKSVYVWKPGPVPPEGVSWHAVVEGISMPELVTEHGPPPVERGYTTAQVPLEYEGEPDEA